MAKLTNGIENDLVKKTVYNTKVTTIETQIAGLTKNTVDNLAVITKLKAIDTNSFVIRTKFSADTNALDDKIDGVEKNTKANTIRSDLTAYDKKADIATDITTIKTDYVTNASLSSQLND